MDLGFNDNPQFTKWAVTNGLLDGAPFVLIDVGVQGGIHPRWNALGGALRVYGFDPLAETIAPLTAQNLPGHSYFSLALGDTDGEREFLATGIKFSSSFFPRLAEQEQARMAIDPSTWADTQARRVPVKRLDSLLAERVISPPDFIKIDCEGFEPAVLSGATKLLAETGLIGLEVETGFTSIHWPQTHFHAVCERLLPLGYRIADLGFNRVPFQSYRERAQELGKNPATISSIGTVQTLFCRNPTAIDRPPHNTIIKAAIIFELFGMLDVAYDVLRVFRSSLPENVTAAADKLV